MYNLVHSVPEKACTEARTIQLNSGTKERTNEEGPMNHRKRDRQTDRERDRDRQRQTEKETETERQTETESERERLKQTD